MELDCPNCHVNIEFDCDELPSNACDSVDYDCPDCEHRFSVGWYAVAEIRGAPKTNPK